MYIVRTLECTSWIVKNFPLFPQTYSKLCLASCTPLLPSMTKSFTVLRHFQDCMAHVQQQPHWLQPRVMMPRFITFPKCSTSLCSCIVETTFPSPSRLPGRSPPGMTLWCLIFPCLENIVDFFESQKLDGVHRPVHVVPVVGEILLFLKGPKHENFGSRFLTSSKPILVGDLRTGKRNKLDACICYIFGENCTRRMLSMRLMF